MDVLQTVQDWLRTFPLWEGTLTVDFTDDVPGNTGLYPRGLQELSRREDVLGGQKVRLQYAFVLRRAAGSGEANARWLLAFQEWVARQDRLGLAPQFGDEPRNQRIRAFQGRLQTHRQVGCSHHTVMLTVEFTKIFRGE